MENRLPLRILLAEDFEPLRYHLRELLGRESDMVVVAEVANGAAAVRRARELRPNGLDVVLMDVDMPVMDGIAATAEITSTDPQLPVIMLTASTLERDLFEAILHGAVGFLSKNLTADALVRALRSFHRDRALPMSRIMAARVLTYLQQERQPRGGHGADNLGLTPREREVLEEISTGAHDAEIAHTLVVSETTVKTHVQHILRKLHARNRAEAVARYRRA